MSDDDPPSPVTTKRAEFIRELAKLILDEIPKGAPGTGNFDAERWVGRWLKERQPALAGRTAGSYIRTMKGRAIVRRLLLQSMTGTYA